MNNELEKDLMNEEIEDSEEVSIEEYEGCRTADFKENVIEWYNGQDIMTVTLSQKRLINKVMKLAKEYPSEVRIDRVNDDGTVLAHLPLKYLRFSRPRELSEEEKLKAKERLLSYKNKKE